MKALLAERTLHREESQRIQKERSLLQQESQEKLAKEAEVCAKTTAMKY